MRSSGLTGVGGGREGMKDGNMRDWAAQVGGDMEGESNERES